jgi:hypothetical protein
MKSKKGLIPRSVSVKITDDKLLNVLIPFMKTVKRLTKKEVRDTIRLGIVCKKAGSFNGSVSRILPKVIVPSSYIEKYWTGEVIRSETWRILSAWQERYDLALFLKETKWSASYSEARDQFAWLKLEQYKNTKRARRLPTSPKILAPAYPTSKLSPQSITMTSDNHGLVSFDNLTIGAYRLSFTAQLPLKFLRGFNHFSGVSKPNIRLTQNDEIYFDFCCWDTKPVLPAPDKSRPALGVDLGVTRPVTMSKVWEDGSWERVPLSGELMRLDKRVKVLESERRLIYKKKSRVERLGVSVDSLVSMMSCISRKITRLKNERDRLIARDVISAGRDCSKVIREKLEWRTGGRSKWSSGFAGDAIDRAGVIHGVRVVHVNPAGTSQSCPKCLNPVRHDGRLTICLVCGYSQDRDIAATRIMPVAEHHSSRLVRNTRPNKNFVKREKRSYHDAVRNNVLSEWFGERNYTGVLSIACTSYVKSATVNGPAIAKARGNLTSAGQNMLTGKDYQRS